MARTAANQLAEDVARRARAAARASWVVRRTTLAADDDDDLSASTTANERLAMMARLALDAWASSGLPLPSYRREETPACVVRRGARAR